MGMLLSAWIQALYSVRARVFLWYVALLSLFVGASTPIMMRAVYREVGMRVSEGFQKDVKLFQGLLQNDPTSLRKLNVVGETLPPLRDPADLIRAFNLYFANHIPEDDTFLIGIIQGEFYRSTPEALPIQLRPGSKSMQTLLEAKISSAPYEETPDLLYKIIPIDGRERTLGRLIVAHVVAGERREALMSLRWVLIVLAIAAILSVIATALVAGRVLRPLEGILQTAKRINERNLTQRVPIEAKGELAELGIAINAMMDRLEAAFQSQRHFVNDAGHELRTPITIMRGHLEVMDISTLPAEEQETIPLVLDELARMERLVNDLILLEKAERPDFLQYEPINLAEFGAELFMKMQALTSADRDWQGPDTVPGELVGDRQRLTQVVMNLAVNAVQHTHPGDRIQLGIRPDGRQCHIWVEDTGEGIATEDQSRIFNRFARVKHTQRKSDGSGLGLAIVKQIIEAHQGQIQLQSQPSKGSRFTLSLPLKPGVTP